ncbi:MAG: hypothetical protein Q8P66_02080 [Candidatus Colwellbacteria bacterium]|nr:hypothetical protein [Candidatus Colwellbacteria bacterium]
MRTIGQWLFEELRNAISFLRLGWEHGGRWARLAIRYTAVVIVGLPIALTLAALTGIHALTGLVIFAAFAALGWVIWAITQPRYQDYLAGGLVVGGGIATVNKLGDIRNLIASGLRGLRIILLTEIAIGAYFFFVPVENNRGLVLGIPILAALMLFSLGLSKGWRIIFFWLPVIVLVGLTLHFFSKEPWYQNWQTENAKAAPAEVKGIDVNVCPGEPDSYNFGEGVTQITVQLQSGCWTGWVTTPPGSSYRVDLDPLGSTAGIEFWDGTALVFKQGAPQYVGTKRGIFRLRNNQGAEDATVTTS